MFILAALLAAATLAEVVGIEAIVGAFFAGLALNRMVPNEGDFMEQIEFFGSSLLIPLFLVSVGTVIDPKVLVDPVDARRGGDLRRRLHRRQAARRACCASRCSASPDREVGVVFGLSVAQAAATLAATFVGLQIGLFTTTTVNAVMIVIVVSLVLASTAAQRYGQQIPKPHGRHHRASAAWCSPRPPTRRTCTGVLEVAARHRRRTDVGVVRPVFIVADGAPEPDARLPHTPSSEAVGRLGIDAELDVRHDRSVNDGVLHASSSFKATLLVVSAATQSWLPTLFGAAPARPGGGLAGADRAGPRRLGDAGPGACSCSRRRRPSGRPARRASPRSSPAGCGPAGSRWSSWPTARPADVLHAAFGRAGTPEVVGDSELAGRPTSPPPTSSSCPAGATAR